MGSKAVAKRKLMTTWLPVVGATLAIAVGAWLVGRRMLPDRHDERKR